MYLLHIVELILIFIITLMGGLVLGICMGELALFSSLDKNKGLIIMTVVKKDKGKDFWSTVIGVGAIGVGLFIGYNIVKNIFHRSEIRIWRCGNCFGILAHRYNHCPHCGVKIRWTNPTSDGIAPKSNVLKTKAFNITCLIVVATLLMRFVCIFIPNVGENHLFFLERIIFMAFGIIIGELVGVTTVYMEKEQCPKK